MSPVQTLKQSFQSLNVAYVLKLITLCNDEDILAIV